MQGIYTYIPETNHVSRVYSVAAILRVLLMVHIMLSSILNSFVRLHFIIIIIVIIIDIWSPASSIKAEHPAHHNIIDMPTAATLRDLH
jgi:hypothetical protein